MRPWKDSGCTVEDVGEGSRDDVGVGVVEDEEDLGGV